MCSRYAFLPEAAAWADFRAVLGAAADELLGLAPRPQLAPTDSVPILVQQPGTTPQVLHARWGLVPHWWNKPAPPRLAFNARSEEAATRPMWRDALRRSRCLIPATSWTEWQHRHGAKIPHTLQRHDGLGFMFAGLWSTWQPRKKGSDEFPGAADEAGKNSSGPLVVVSCVILTTAATPDIVEVHDRMPVVLAPEAWAAWLDPATTDPDVVATLLRQHTVRAITAFAVARR